MEHRELSLELSLPLLLPPSDLELALPLLTQGGSVTIMYSLQGREGSRVSVAAQGLLWGDWEGGS